MNAGGTQDKGLEKSRQNPFSESILRNVYVQRTYLRYVSLNTYRSVDIDLFAIALTEPLTVQYWCQGDFSRSKSLKSKYQKWLRCVYVHKYQKSIRLWSISNQTAVFSVLNDEPHVRKTIKHSSLRQMKLRRLKFWIAHSNNVPDCIYSQRYQFHLCKIGKRDLTEIISVLSVSVVNSMSQC